MVSPPPADRVSLSLGNGATVHLPTGRQVALAPRDAALLTWLALEGPTPRTGLARLLWPDSAVDAARNALRQRLFQLRKQLGVELVSGQAMLALREGIAHDLDDADSVLAGVSLELGSELAEWLARQRERRSERVGRSLTELSEMAERAGDWADALVHARELVALDPLSEEAHRRVMRLHYLAGDRAAALLAFDRCERVLKDEVGARPSPPTMALLDTIERAKATPAPAPIVVPPAVLRPPRFVGRDAERRLLAQACREPMVIVLRGEAGMGKSRLLAELAGDAGSKATLIAVGARPGDAAVPYALAGRWLRKLIASYRLVLDAQQRQDLAPLLPELADALPPLRDRLSGTVKALFGQALRQGLRTVAIDDLQFADAASVALLHSLAGLGNCGWIVAMRPAELDATAQAFIAAMEGLASTHAAVSPLDVVAIEGLLDSLGLDGLGGRVQAMSLLAHTGGNPLFLLETLKAALPGPEGGRMRSVAPSGGVPWPVAGNVLRLIQLRLARLGAPALSLARCAAVAGQDLCPDLAAQVLGLRLLDLADAWRELEDAQVLRDGGFAHDLGSV